MIGGMYEEYSASFTHRGDMSVYIQGVGFIENAKLSITKKTWIWSPKDLPWTFEFLDGPSMNTERSYHSCGKMISKAGKTLIVVSGGQNSFGEVLDSVELLDAAMNKEWIAGKYVYSSDGRYISL